MTAAPSFTSDFLQTLQARGYVHQISHAEALDQAAASGVVPAYIGFDATAPSFHVGNLVSIMLLRRLQQSGHKPIVLMGGGTTKVGDPSGKDATRQLLTPEQIAENIQSLEQVFSRFLHFGDGPSDAIMVDNAEWLDRFGYIQFLRDYGVHFTVNRLLTFDSVKTRLDREQPLTFIEFNYMLMQSVDFLELSRRYGCMLQMGGSDQWGNIVSGVDLIRRVDQRPAFALTSPLITTSSGAKMGKTAAGAVWLNADRLSPFDYWQFWRNTEDADVGRFLRLFTDLPLDEIAALERLEGAKINEAKKVLANEATALLHGRPEADRAAKASRRTFEDGAVSADLPSIMIPAAALAPGIPLAVLAVDAGLASSRSDARRLAQGGGLRVNDRPEADAQRLITVEDLGPTGAIKLSAGRKKIVLVKIV
jgi:tyrosyl-tRNA synthetase